MDIHNDQRRSSRSHVSGPLYGCRSQYFDEVSFMRSSVSTATQRNANIQESDRVKGFQRQLPRMLFVQHHRKGTCQDIHSATHYFSHLLSTKALLAVAIKTFCSPFMVGDLKRERERENDQRRCSRSRLQVLHAEDGQDRHLPTLLFVMGRQNIIDNVWEVVVGNDLDPFMANPSSK